MGSHIAPTMILLFLSIFGRFYHVMAKELSFFFAAPCDSRNVTVSVYKLESPGSRDFNKLLPNNTVQLVLKHYYYLHIYVPDDTMNLVLKFTSEAALVLDQLDPTARFEFRKPTELKQDFQFTFTEKINRFGARVYGPPTGVIPHIRSILADSTEICEYQRIGYFDEITSKYYKGSKLSETNSRVNDLDKSCGRRKVLHTELIVNGQTTKPGDWPWHVAISRIEGDSLTYICGGTLVSKTLVLTAAHCASISGNAVIPDSLIVHLGKHNRFGGNIASQEREVFRIILHPDFSATRVNNDIALLKLKSEAVFTDYVQPACLVRPGIDLPTEDVFGTIVGWGYNQKVELSSTLQQATIPIVSELQCLKSNPVFFQMKLDTNKFCAGYNNGTSACNGDSGGGLMIFQPDTLDDDDSEASGSWYIRGIISFSKKIFYTNICDPTQYTIFTDVAKYWDWLSKYLE
ncbi:hypothetical protein PYW07_010589 [Mythimna separata]|uniref:Peptidase S1 domain-containing protein n=1 Tax=Mythimna separata TaxID=271217 RepID=A0AAD8DMH8_MYTSE|nr:hypothetical protein PYW07_010589 [Mythimna separata]